MDELDNEFFEEYKHLNKICSEIYNNQNGISAYIEDMERHWNSGCRYVHSWKNDYNQLKHVRYIRNQIAHNDCEGGLSEQEDLDFVKNFFQRIMSSNDAISQLTKRIEQANKERKIANQTDKKAEETSSNQANSFDMEKYRINYNGSNYRKDSSDWLVPLFIVLGIVGLGIISMVVIIAIIYSI